MSIRSIAALAAAGVILVAWPACAEDADWYRGGWRTEGSDPHVYQFVIRGERVSGIYCTHCADGTTLAPIEGTFDEDEGLTFTIRHLDPQGATVSQDRLRARLEGGKLRVSGTRGGEAFEHVAIKDPRGPTPGPYRQSILPPNAPPVPVLPPALLASAKEVDWPIAMPPISKKTLPGSDSHSRVVVTRRVLKPTWI